MSFVNPYNFVSLEGKCDKRHRPIPTTAERSGERLYTGVLNCVLRTKTPLFIPNTTSGDAFPLEAREILMRYNSDNNKRANETCKSYDFYSYADLSENPRPTETPVIPGSSIRGAIRSVYETITNSCLSTSGGGETPLYRRTTAAKTSFGVIKDGVLYKARKYLVKVNNPSYSPHPFGNELDALTLAHGQELWFTPTRSPFKKTIPGRDGAPRVIELSKGVARLNENGEGTQGFYLKGEPFGTRKHFDAVMAPEKDRSTGEWIVERKLSREDIERLETLIALYSKGKDGVNQSPNHGEYRDFLKASVMPVYYSKIGDSCYISPAAISKDVFNRTIAGILREQGGHDACADASRLCEACHLFGMAGAGSSSARSSRVQFRDALPAEDGGYMGEITAMAVLGSPKITATEFYMDPVPPDKADIFNYDYASIGGRGVPLKAVGLRGRKFYWHHGTAPKTNNKDDVPKLFQVARPVLADKPFGFTVAFERLTLDELKKLRYALELDEDGAHKLGNGKPIGYGSVKIAVDREKSLVYSINGDMELTAEALPPAAFDFSFDNAEFHALTSIKDPKENISYPSAAIINGQKATKTVFNWFMLNREANGGSAATSPKFAYVLPKADDADPSLPEITKNGRQITQGRGTNR